MYKEIKMDQVGENFVDLINKQWALLTAGDEKAYNTMTISWGSFGELWFEDMVTVYVRPQRYTREFLDDNEYFTVSFYNPEKHDALAFCGSKSGRDYDKAKETGLVPVFDEKAPYFEEAKLVMVCRKVAKSQLDESNFIDKSYDDKCYSAKDYSYLYYGVVEKVLILE